METQKPHMDELAHREKSLKEEYVDLTVTK